MRRIVLLVAVVLVIAAMMLGMALPAFAAGPETGECARSIAQGETEIKGNKGEAIRSLCVLTKGLQALTGPGLLCRGQAPNRATTTAAARVFYQGLAPHPAYVDGWIEGCLHRIAEDGPDGAKALRGYLSDPEMRDPFVGVLRCVQRGEGVARSGSSRAAVEVRTRPDAAG